MNSRADFWNLRIKFIALQKQILQLPRSPKQIDFLETIEQNIENVEGIIQDFDQTTDIPEIKNLEKLYSNLADQIKQFIADVSAQDQSVALLPIYAERFKKISRKLSNMKIPYHQVELLDIRKQFLIEMENKLDFIRNSFIKNKDFHQFETNYQAFSKRIKGFIKNPRWYRVYFEMEKYLLNLNYPEKTDQDDAIIRKELFSIYTFKPEKIALLEKINQKLENLSDPINDTNENQEFISLHREINKYVLESFIYDFTTLKNYLEFLPKLKPLVENQNKLRISVEKNIEILQTMLSYKEASLPPVQTIEDRLENCLAVAKKIFSQAHFHSSEIYDNLIASLPRDNKSDTIELKRQLKIAKDTIHDDPYEDKQVHLHLDKWNDKEWLQNTTDTLNYYVSYVTKFNAAKKADQKSEAEITKDKTDFTLFSKNKIHPSSDEVNPITVNNWIKRK